jgi:subtilisin inhibitor-like
MRVVLAALAGSAVAAAGVAAASPDGSTALRIAYFADGRKPETKVVWTLRCDPAGGTLPRPAIACRELGRRGWQTLRPVPPDTACTEIYGGPQVALVTGVVDGRRVWVRLRRDNGCEIDRWNRNAFLVPASP